MVKGNKWNHVNPYDFHMFPTDIPYMENLWDFYRIDGFDLILHLLSEGCWKSNNYLTHHLIIY